VENPTGIATVMTDGKLSDASGSAEHLAAVRVAQSVQTLTDLDGWGVYLRSYTLDGVEWSAVVLAHADLSEPGGSRFVNIHAFGSTIAAVQAWRAVTDALATVHGR
jgi:hypothetical protein